MARGRGWGRGWGEGTDAPMEHASAYEDRFSRGGTKCGRKFARVRSCFTRSTIPKRNKSLFVAYLGAFF